MILHSSAGYLPQIKNIWQEVFGDSDEYIKLFFNCKYRPDETLLHVERDRVLAMVFFPRYDIRIKGAVYGAGYLCGAATVPECRGRGLMGSLLQGAFYAMQERGDRFSMLIPAERRLCGFYARHGFRPFFKKGFIGYSRKDLQASGRRVSLLKTVDAALISRVYREITANLEVAVMQNVETYSTVIKVHESQGGEIYMLRDVDGGYAGYLFCYIRQPDCFLHVKEIICRSDIMTHAASALYRIYPRVKRVVFHGPAGISMTFPETIDAGMLKVLDGQLSAPACTSTYPYMNMMLD